MKYLVVLPYVYQPYFDECMETVKFPRENMLLIDNTQTNIGIMKSHNMGIDKMREVGADYLIVMSASIRFGEPGGLDFLEIIEQHPDDLLIHAKGEWLDVGDNNTIKNMSLGWHLTAFKREVFDNVGRWDQNFTPYGFDDVDLYLRTKKHYGEGFANNAYDCDMKHVSTSHSIQLGGVVSPSSPKILYFTEKWGRHPKAWMWDGWEHPFNEEDKDLKYWPPARDGGRYDDNSG